MHNKAKDSSGAGGGHSGFPTSKLLYKLHTSHGIQPIFIREWRSRTLSMQYGNALCGIAEWYQFFPSTACWNDRPGSPSLRRIPGPEGLARVLPVFDNSSEVSLLHLFLCCCCCCCSFCISCLMMENL